MGLATWVASRGATATATSHDTATVIDLRDRAAVADVESPAFELAAVGAELTVLDLPVIFDRPDPPAGAYACLAKPLIDRVAAGVLLVLLVPVLLAIALLVLATMGRGVFYRQERVGLGGTTFRMVKFRTMAHDRRKQSMPFAGVDRRQVHKTTADPRHTPVGMMLRRSSLDELPQLWNVVRGDMSLVGPRPELPSIVSRYEPWQHGRHVVRPGITGLWQINQRGEGMMHDFTHIDLEYVRHVSLATDVKIVLRTVPALLRRAGS